MMRDLGLIQNNEPTRKLFTQGMAIRDGAKMSKNKGNVIGADEVSEQYGADSARLFVLFAAPPEREVDWTRRPVSKESTVLLAGLPLRHAQSFRREDAWRRRCGRRKVLRKLHQTIKEDR